LARHVRSHQAPSVSTRDDPGPPSTPEHHPPRSGPTPAPPLQRKRFVWRQGSWDGANVHHCSPDGAHARHPGLFPGLRKQSPQSGPKAAARAAHIRATILFFFFSSFFFFFFFFFFAETGRGRTGAMKSFATQRDNQQWSSILRSIARPGAEFERDDLEVPAGKRARNTNAAEVCGKRRSGNEAPQSSPEAGARRHGGPALDHAIEAYAWRSTHLYDDHAGQDRNSCKSSNEMVGAAERSADYRSSASKCVR